MNKIIVQRSRWGMAIVGIWRYGAILPALLLVFGALPLNEARAFGRATHAGITQAAFGRSSVAGDALMQQLGLFDLDPTSPFSEYYYDVSGNDPHLRTADEPAYSPSPYEETLIEKVGGPSLSITGWLMRGAIREDDTPLLETM